MLVLSAVLAWGAKPVENAVLFDDPYARWQGSRWYVQAAAVMPLPLHLQADRNDEVHANLFEYELVMSCKDEFKLGKHSHEVACRVDDAALRLAPVRQVGAADAVVTEVVGKLKGATLQLQVKDDGRIASVDLEGLPKGSERQQVTHESLRKLLASGAAGFDIALPAPATLPKDGWEEKRPAMLRIPTAESVMAKGRVAHTTEAVDQHYVVTTEVTGMVSPTLLLTALYGSPEEQLAEQQSNRNAGMNELLEGATLDEGGVGLNIPAAPAPMVAEGQTFAITGAAVAAFEQGSGILTERVWNVKGGATAQAGSSVPGFAVAGRIDMLDDGESKSLQPSGLLTNN